MRANLPYARRGQRIGLLGGSFDPAHAGHVHVTKTALKRFGLDQVWWLVSPGNPLKTDGPAPMDDRLAAAYAVMDHPQVIVSDLEAQLNSRYTSQTVSHLVGLYPGVRFVWLMGADNLAQFHLWRDWQSIANTLPIGVVSRPGHESSARNAKAARMMSEARLPGFASQLLANREAPAWCYLNAPLHEQSSSAIRAKGLWPVS